MPTLDSLRPYAAAIRSQGIVLAVIGALCILAPVLFTLTFSLLFGILILVAGAVQASRAWSARRHQSALVPGLWALLCLVIGVVMVVSPGAAAGALTLILAMFLAAQGIFQWSVAWQFEPKDRLGLASGGLSVLLALLIWMEWPSSAGWVLGTFVGVAFLANGAALIAFAGALRR